MESADYQVSINHCKVRAAVKRKRSLGANRAAGTGLSGLGSCQGDGWSLVLLTSNVDRLAATSNIYDKIGAQQHLLSTGAARVAYRALITVCYGGVVQKLLLDLAPS
jgi:hypothetical protein